MACGEQLPQKLKQPQRQQLSILLHAGWLDAPAQPAGEMPRFCLNEDVTFSLVLEDDEPTETACASVWTAPSGQRKFTWLDDG